MIKEIVRMIVANALNIRTDDVLFAKMTIYPDMAIGFAKYMFHNSELVSDISTIEYIKAMRDEFKDLGDNAVEITFDYTIGRYLVNIKEAN